jgi:hypothetical protein
MSITIQLLGSPRIARESGDTLRTAIGYAVRAAAMSPLDENHQALLIRLYRMAGDDDAAARQFAAASMLAAESEMSR